MKKYIYSLLFFVLISATGFAQDSMNVSRIYHWEDSTLISSADHDNTYNEVWGFEQGGRYYGVIGSTAGAHIFDVTNPANATLVDFVPGSSQGDHIIHRDFHDYEGYLYMVSDEGNSTLQIIDLSYLPDSVHQVYNSSQLFSRSHNIYIDTATAKLYSCGGSSQFAIYDLTVPDNPTYIVDCEFDVFWWGNTVAYVHDVYVRNDTAYCNGEDGLYVVDFTTPTNPTLLSSLTSYPDMGYNHSGWLSENGEKFIMADETHGFDVKLLDVSDLGNITVDDQFSSGVDPISIAHNPIIYGNHAFVSYYQDGLQIFDISDPANVTVSGYYDTSTSPHDSTYQGNWGVYPFLPGMVLASDMQNGFYIFDASAATVGTDDFNIFLGNPFTIYPNPYKEDLFIQNEWETTHQVEYGIFSLSGKQVAKGQLTLMPGETQRFPTTNDLAVGAYFIRLVYNNHQSTVKLIKTED